MKHVIEKHHNFSPIEPNIYTCIINHVSVDISTTMKTSVRQHLYPWALFEVASGYFLENYFLKMYENEMDAWSE